MHILYIHQHFATPNGSTGTRSYEFARRWAAKGHKVTMLTSTAQLTRADLAQARGRLFKRFCVDGIDVIALAVPYRQRMSMLARCWAFLVFLLLASVTVLFIRGIDIVYATSTPLTVGVPALVARWFRCKKYVFEVRDQWPQIPIVLGIIKNKLLIKILLWLEKTIYKNSSAIVAGSPGQAEGIQKVCPKHKKVEIVTNSCDTKLFRPDIDGSIIRGKYGWKNKFVLLHAGAMGKVNSLHFIIDVAEKLRDNKEILFVLIGQGNEKASLEKRVSELNLDNVQILPPAEKMELPKFFAAADVGLVIIGNFSILEHNSANKFFDSLSAGKPVLLNYSGWQRKIIEDNEAGLGCKLCDLGEFIDTVIYYYKNRNNIGAMGRNARRIAVEKFDREKLAFKVLSSIELVLGKMEAE